MKKSKYTETQIFASQRKFRSTRPENTNGLVRQYLKKGASFEAVTEQQLITIMNKLNDRPRKTLGFKTPAMLFLSQTNDEKSAVALASYLTLTTLTTLIVLGLIIRVIRLSLLRRRSKKRRCRCLLPYPFPQYLMKLVS